MDGGAVGIGDGLRITPDEDGCAFILDGGIRRAGAPTICGAERRAGSSYCAHHHAICHLAEGSAGERRRLRETEALATAVGGRRGRQDRVPSDRFLRRLERAARDFSRTDCSLIVPGRRVK